MVKDIYGNGTRAKKRLHYLDSPAVKKANEIIIQLRIEAGEKCDLELTKNNLNEFYKVEIIKNTYCNCVICNYIQKSFNVNA